MVYPSESRSRSWFKSRKTVCVRFRTRNHGLQGRPTSQELCRPGLTRCISRSTRSPKHRIVGLAILLVVFATLCLFVLSARRADHVGRASRHTQHVGPLDAWDHILFQDDEADDGGDLISQEDHVSSRQAPAGPGIARWQEGIPEQPLCPRPGSNTSIYAKYAKTPNLLRRSILYPGSGNDLLRVLQRAANLSRNAFLQDTKEALKDPFRVMVMGGSVSNCRGVERQLCWHSHLMRWLANMFPLDQDEQQAQYRFIDLAKSATGSTFFSYCWHSELVLRKKHTPYYWGDGPDLIIIETGINDVVSPSDFTTKASSQSYEDDFESLLWQLKSLPSRPAIVVLDAASRLLDKRQALHESAEFTTHLGPSVWLDVPVISAKTGLLTPEGQRDLKKLGDLYLADGHHPNIKGHEVLADMLLAHLEDLTCRLDDVPVKPQIPPELPLVHSSKRLQGQASSLMKPPTGECIQVGAGGEKRKPRKNRGWSRLASSRDKQYMASSIPGSRLSYSVNVGVGGHILLSWLCSRFYNLGEARMLLDEQKPGVTISGHWELGWSIGVPTVLFENVTAGRHTVTVEHVKPKSRASAASTGTSNFRLIAIATT